MTEVGERYRCFLSTNETPILFDIGLEETTDDCNRIGPYEAVHVQEHEPDNYVLVDEITGVAVMGGCRCRN